MIEKLQQRRDRESEWWKADEISHLGTGGHSAEPCYLYECQHQSPLHCDSVTEESENAACTWTTQQIYSYYYYDYNYYYYYYYQANSAFYPQWDRKWVLAKVWWCSASGKYRHMCSFHLWIKHAGGFWLSKVYRPTKHIIGHTGDWFLWVKWPNQLHQSTKGKWTSCIKC